MDKKLSQSKKVINTRVTTTITEVVEVSKKIKLSSSPRPISYEKKSTKPIARTPKRGNSTAVVNKRPSSNSSTSSLGTTKSLITRSLKSPTVTPKRSISAVEKSPKKLSSSRKSLSSSTSKSPSKLNITDEYFHFVDLPSYETFMRERNSTPKKEENSNEHEFGSKYVYPDIFEVYMDDSNAK